MQVPETGFRTVECGSTKASLPMPNDWFFREDIEQGTRAYFLTREEIKPGKMFATGLSLNAMARLSRTRQIPSLLGERLMVDPQPGRTPAGELQVIEDGPLITYRQMFDYAGGVVEGQLVDPAWQYWSVTSNDRRDIVYVAMFETPNETAEAFRDVARIMIENITYDPRVR